MTKLKNRIHATSPDYKTNNLLYGVVIVLFLVWGIGFLTMNVGAVIHLLLLIAVGIILWKNMGRRRTNI